MVWMRVVWAVSFLVYTTTYFSCLLVTSVRQDRLRPLGIGFTTSMKGEEGPGMV